MFSVETPFSTDDRISTKFRGQLLRVLRSVLWVRDGECVWGPRRGFDPKGFVKEVVGTPRKKVWRPSYLRLSTV